MTTRRRSSCRKNDGLCAGSVRPHVRAAARSGEGKGTQLELFADGILDLEPEIRDLIRAAA